MVFLPILLRSKTRIHSNIMLQNRIIPVLLLEDEGLVKTKKFKEPKYIGDPVNTVRIFNTKEVDEIFLLDIHASRNKIAPNFDLVSEIASECFMPLCYGGGIRNLADAEKLFSIGVEKISIQTSALKDLNIVNQIASKFGAQAVVVSVDIKRDFFGKAKLYSSSTKDTVNIEWLNFSKSAVNAGAGEIFINSVDKDGTLSGPDIQLVTEAAGSISTPLTYSGGVSSLNDIRNLIKAGASAVAAGAFFVFNGPNRAVLISYPRYSEIKKLFI